MTIFETMTRVEDLIYQLDCAGAVLVEAEHYFEFKIEPGSTEAYYLAKQAEHISILLHVVEEYLCDAMPELRTVVCELLERHKTEKEEKTA